VAYLPGGKQLVTGSYDGVVKVWTVGEAQLVRAFPAHADGVTCLAPRPDGAALASGGLDGQVRLWDLGSGAQVSAQAAHPGGVTALAWTPDGSELLSAGSSGLVRRWRGGSEVGQLKGHTRAVHAVRVAAGGARIATGSWDGTVRLWTPGGAEQARLDGHGGWLESLDFSPDGATLAWGRGHDVVLTPLAGGPVRALQGHSREVCAVRFLPGGAQLVSVGFDREIVLWDVATGAAAVRRPGPPGLVYHLGLAPDGSQVAVAGGHVLERLAIPGFQAIDPDDGHRGEVRALAFTRNRLVSASGDGSVRVWDPNIGMSRAFRDQGDVGGLWALAVDPEGTRAAVGGGDRRVRIFDLAGGEVSSCWEGHLDEVRAVAWSPTRAMVASGSRDGEIIFWEVGHAERVGTLPGHPGGIDGLAFSANGRVLVSIGGDRKLRVWDVVGAKLLLEKAGDPRGLKAVAFTADGAGVVTAGSDGRVLRWRLRDGEVETRYQGAEGWLYALAVRGDAVAAAGEDGRVWRWPAAGGAPQVRAGHEGWVYALALSEDGRLASGGGDTGVLVG
jgi:WD40 repeat protein